MKNQAAKLMVHTPIISSGHMLAHIIAGSMFFKNKPRDRRKKYVRGNFKQTAGENIPRNLFDYNIGCLSRSVGFQHDFMCRGNNSLYISRGKKRNIRVGSIGNYLHGGRLSGKILSEITLHYDQSADIAAGQCFLCGFAIIIAGNG